MSRVLILFAHPALHKSRVNRAMVDAVRDLSGVRLHDLYEEYPDFDIDVKREQEILEASDTIVFQHPFYWYSTPALLKEWQDLVLEHGWAYGEHATALAGKRAFNALTAGGGEESYCGEGYNRYSVRQLLAPLEQTVRLCGMEYLPPFAVHGTHRFGQTDIRRHAADYRRLISSFATGAVDLDAIRATHRMNADLSAVIKD